jgi:hypothetical protein
MKFTCVLYTPYIQRLKIISYNILKNFVHEAKFYSVEFSTCGVMSGVKKFQVLGNFTFLDSECSPFAKFLQAFGSVLDVLGPLMRLLAAQNHPVLVTQVLWQVLMSEELVTLRVPLQCSPGSFCTWLFSAWTKVLL